MPRDAARFALAAYAGLSVRTLRARLVHLSTPLPHYRVGGKILTRKFDTAPAMYEAGVAEIYDYSMTGPDPLRELIQHFGLQTIPMDAEQVQFDGELLNDVPGMRRKYGAKTADAKPACASLRRRRA